METTSLLIGLAIGLGLGALAVWFIQSFRLASGRARVEERCSGLESSLAKTNGELAVERQRVVGLNADLAGARADAANAQKRLQEQMQEFENVQQRLKTEFENLANRILEEKATKFAAQNQTSLEQLLNPLRSQITEFRQRVDTIYNSDTADRAAIKNQIESLTKLNEEVNEEARKLVNALKGEAKSQGNWGEMILEKVLERSGLTREVEYVIQSSMTGADGSRLQPDVVIKLPEDKHFVVDSKVSLTAYERYCSADDEKQREQALKEHLASVRNHVKELSAKNYQALYQINAPDFVFMFIPVEPAFSLAAQRDPQLFSDAFEKQIVLVTPSTLLATLRTVASIWKQEKQNKNALEIARQGGALYDQFVSFYNDLLEVGERIKKTSDSYDNAMDRLKNGRGNLVKRVEDLRKLGARAQKSLPARVVEEADGDEPPQLETGARE